MLGLWSASATVYTADYSNCEIDLNGRTQADDRERKRRRRIIPPLSESDTDDGEDFAALGHHRSIDQCRGLLGNVPAASLGIPSTSHVADPLGKGVRFLASSFPRRSLSPCQGLTSAFVAVHEEPNSGFRHYMEDRSAAMTAGAVAYLGIYDGHGGVDASTFLQQHLLPTIQAHLQPGYDVHGALTAAYMATNDAFRATGSIQGSTATTIILNNTHLIAANVGDSPAFVVKKCGNVCSVIREHKIEGDEAARIAAQGVPIYRSPTGPAYMGTPDGTRWLNMSRAFGDFVYPAISCEPYVCSLDVSDGKYLVMGSDGLTEKWPVGEAAQYLTQLADAGWSLSAICRRLVEQSMARGSTDNISCMIVDLEAYMRHAEAALPMRGQQHETAGTERSRENTVDTTVVARFQQRLPTSDGVVGQLLGISDNCEGYAVEDGSEQQLWCQDEAGLLCNEDLSGGKPHPEHGGKESVLGSNRIIDFSCGGAVSGAALASCAANALGAARGANPDGGCWQRVDSRLAADQVPMESGLPNESGPASVIYSHEAGGISSSPARSSPNVCEDASDSYSEIETREGDRHATPQPVQTACRSLAVNGDGHQD